MPIKIVFADISAVEVREPVAILMFSAAAKSPFKLARPATTTCLELNFVPKNSELPALMFASMVKVSV